MNQCLISLIRYKENKKENLGDAREQTELMTLGKQQKDSTKYKYK